MAGETLKFFLRAGLKKILWLVRHLNTPYFLSVTAKISSELTLGQLWSLQVSVCLFKSAKKVQYYPRQTQFRNVKILKQN